MGDMCTKMEYFSSSSDSNYLQKKLLYTQQMIDTLDECEGDLDELALCTPRAINAINRITVDDCIQNLDFAFLLSINTDRISSVQDELKKKVYKYKQFCPEIKEDDDTASLGIKRMNKPAVNPVNKKYLWEYY